MTAVSRAYLAIRDGILSGEYPPGTYLRETVIAKKLAVSRTPIRETIRRLVSEGWLESAPNRGARVVQWTDADLDEVYELRALLEPMLAKRVASRVSTEQIDGLEKLAVAMEKLANSSGVTALDEITVLNQRFHEGLAQIADRPMARRILKDVVVVPIARRSFHYYTKGELQRSMNDHQEIIHALRARDGEWAAAIMRDHILAARARISFRNRKTIANDTTTSWRKNGTASRY